MKKSNYTEIDLPAAMHSENKFRVPIRQWRKWSLLARRAFNGVYSAMIESPWAFQPPSAKVTNGRAWKVTAWNAAWIAADAIKEAGA